MSPRRTSGRAGRSQAPRRRRKISGPFFAKSGSPYVRGPGGPEGGDWIVVEKSGDFVKAYRHTTKEGVRRLAGLRARKEDEQ